MNSFSSAWAADKLEFTSLFVIVVTIWILRLCWEYSNLVLISSMNCMSSSSASSKWSYCCILKIFGKVSLIVYLLFIAWISFTLIIKINVFFLFSLFFIGKYWTNWKQGGNFIIKNKIGKKNARNLLYRPSPSPKEGISLENSSRWGSRTVRFLESMLGWLEIVERNV